MRKIELPFMPIANDVYDLYRLIIYWLVDVKIINVIIHYFQFRSRILTFVCLFVFVGKYILIYKLQASIL